MRIKELALVEVIRAESDLGGEGFEVEDGREGVEVSGGVGSLSQTVEVREEQGQSQSPEGTSFNQDGRIEGILFRRVNEQVLKVFRSR